MQHLYTNGIDVPKAHRSRFNKIKRIRSKFSVLKTMYAVKFTIVNKVNISIKKLIMLA